MALPYPGWSVAFNDTPSAAKWNQLGSDLDALAAGTGLNTNAVTADKLATSAVYLGSAQITSNFSSASTTAVQVTGLTATVTVPSGGRKVKITVFASDLFNNVTGLCVVTIWDGTVGSGTQLARLLFNPVSVSSGLSTPAIVMALTSPSAGSKTYNVGFNVSTGTGTLEAGSIYPALLLVEVI